MTLLFLSQASVIMVTCNLNLVRCWIMKQWKILLIYSFFATSSNTAIMFFGMLWAALSYWQCLPVNFYSHVCSRVPFLLTLAGAGEWFLLGGVPWGLHWECSAVYIWDLLSHPSVHQHWVRERLHASVQKISHGGQFDKQCKFQEVFSCQIKSYLKSHLDSISSFIALMWCTWIRVVFQSWITVFNFRTTSLYHP